MKAVFCSFRTYGVHGRQKDRHRTFIIGLSKTGYLPSALSASPLTIGTSVSTSSFARIISHTGMLNAFFNTLCGTFQDGLSCCGIAERSTSNDLFNCFSINTRGFTLNSSRRMHLNSTRPNTSGIAQTSPCPTGHATVEKNSTSAYSPSLLNSDPHKMISGLAFMPPTYPCHVNSSFLY